MHKFWPKEQAKRAGGKYASGAERECAAPARLTLSDAVVRRWWAAGRADAARGGWAKGRADTRARGSGGASLVGGAPVVSDRGAPRGLTLSVDT